MRSILLFAVFVVGCGAHSPFNTPRELSQEEKMERVREMAAERARVIHRATIKFEPGMGADAVAQMIGSPDEQEGRMCGPVSGPQFKCVMWTYYEPGQQFVIVFEPADGGRLALSRWDWLSSR